MGGITQQIPPSPRYCYVPNGWDTAWKAAKANSSSSHALMTAIGDSITFGWNASDFMSAAWWPQLRSALLATNPLGGDYYGMMYSAAYESALGGSTTATPPVVVNGTNGVDYTPYYGGFGLTPALQNALSPFITCTPPYSVTGFDIVYVDFGAGTWKYQIDSGAQVAVSPTGPFTLAGSSVKKVSITGLTSGTHTLKIHWDGTGGANVCIPCGITAYASTTTGLCFANMGVPGLGLSTGTSTENALSYTGRFPVDKLALYQGYQGATSAPTALSGLGFPAQPDLAIIALGTNDATQGVTRANYRDALARLVWSLRYGKSDACSILLVAMCCPDGTVASSTAVANTDSGAVYTAYRDIRAAMVEVAQAETCAFVDIHGVFGRTPITNGWITSTSDLHPTNAGHTKIATTLSALL